jgi:hypothetical protein
MKLNKANKSQNHKKTTAYKTPTISTGTSSNQTLDRLVKEPNIAMGFFPISHDSFHKRKATSNKTRRNFIIEINAPMYQRLSIENLLGIWSITN